TAVYLELYVEKGKLQSIIQTNIMNLAGVPSIVYGILGLTIFVRALGFGNIVLAGGLTMSLLVLPIIVAVSQEAIRAVPHHLRDRKSTRLNSSHVSISYAVFCLK